MTHFDKPHKCDLEQCSAYSQRLYAWEGQYLCQYHYHLAIDGNRKVKRQPMQYRGYYKRTCVGCGAKLYAWSRKSRREVCEDCRIAASERAAAFLRR